MNWKEFLKPNLKKIILFAIITYITWFMPLIPITSQQDILMCNTVTGECLSPTSTSYQAAYAFLDMKVAMMRGGFFGEIGAIFLLVFLNYLISCSIIYLYNKVKKK